MRTRPFLFFLTRVWIDWSTGYRSTMCSNNANGGFNMRPRLLASLAVVTVLLVVSFVSRPFAQGAAQGGRTGAATKYKVARTAWGEPDLQGVWSYANLTPLER